MENIVKGTKFDDRNDHGYCKYCSDAYQYNCHSDQYDTILQDT